MRKYSDETESAYRSLRRGPMKGRCMVPEDPAICRILEGPLRQNRLVQRNEVFGSLECLVRNYRFHAFRGQP